MRFRLPVIIIQSVALRNITFLSDLYLITVILAPCKQTIVMSCVCRSKENSDTCVQDD